MSDRHYLLMAGGTGGHVFPALAVAEELIARGASVSWLGTAAGIEAKVVPAAGIDLHTISIKGFRGKRIIGKLLIPLLLLRAIFQSMKVISKQKPQVVVGFGGFVSGPGGVAARLLGKKLVVHEQNAIAGTTNRLLAKVAHRELVAFPDSLPGAEHVGNPLRKSLVAMYDNTERKDIKQELNLLIMGGSLGAKAINELLPEAIALLDSAMPLNIWHQTGRNKAKETENAYQKLAVQAKVVEFIDDVADAYQWADIIVCRAGALTVSEVSIAGVPAIFIPFPYAIDDHQTHNAQWLVQQGAAIVVQQKELTPEKLKALLLPLLIDRQQLVTMSEQAKRAAMPQATIEVANICEEMANDN